jgi:hypothetical protein
MGSPQAQMAHFPATALVSTVPCLVFPFVLRFDPAMPIQAMPIAPLRGLCAPALNHFYNGHAANTFPGDVRPILIKPEREGKDHPQPFVFHCGPSRLLYTEDAGRNSSQEHCEALHGTIHAFLNEPSAIDILLEALASFGKAAARKEVNGGWPSSRGWTGFSLARAPEHFNADPAPWSPHTWEEDDAWGAWEVELITPWRQEVKVARNETDVPLERMPLHKLFGPGPHAPCYFHGKPVTRQLLLYCLAMGSIRRLEGLAKATGSACLIDHRAIATLIWEQARVTRAAVTPRDYTYYRKEDGTPIHLHGLVGRIEFEGPAILARVLASGSFTGIGGRTNYGSGRIDIRPL